MLIEYVNSNSLDNLTQALARVATQPEIKSVLLLGCDENGWSAEDLDPLLMVAPVPVFGALFPQVIHQQMNYSQGAVLVGLPCEPEWIVVEGLSNEQADFDAVLAPVADDWVAEANSHTLMVLVDGLATRIAALIESLFFNFGLEQNMIGGGAGSLSFEQKPCLITPQGVKVDAALLVKMPWISGVGVAHGWQPISDTLKVTESSRNRVRSLDWQPAFSAYRTLVEAHGDQRFGEDNFFDIAKSYPLGISKLDTEMVVRDPLMTSPESELVCVGEVPEGCFVKVLNGTPESLIAAAAQARSTAESAFQASGRQPQATFFIDCISRVLFMGDRITQEFAQVADGLPLFGALTLGEIANTGQDYLEFYNKTAVVGLLAETPSNPAE